MLTDEGPNLTRHLSSICSPFLLLIRLNVQKEEELGEGGVLRDDDRPQGPRLLCKIF